jgi:glutathione synthase/RimK-type ligase-like ATP-grasp enzyme
VNPSILILSTPDDAHARIVGDALRARGADVATHCLSTFPDRSAFAWSSVDPWPELFPGATRPDVVWLRRPVGARPDLSRIHPEDRAAVQVDCDVVLGWALSELDATTAFVNPWGAHVHASNKLRQLRLACEAGLAVPATIASNDDATIRAFLAAHRRVAFKPVAKTAWTGGGDAHFPIAALVDAGKLPSAALLRQSPAFFQQVIDKVYEVRVNVMDCEVVSVRIDGAHVEGDDIDWHKAGTASLRLSPYTLPDPVAAACVRLVRMLGLRFATIDLCVDGDAGYHFLEVNQMGQFLWLDEMCPEVGITATFCDFLLGAADA